MKKISIMKILEVFQLSNLKINKFAKLRRFSKNCRVLEFFIFSIFRVTRTIGLSTFKRMLICKYETSAILKFYCSKF